MAPVYPQEHTGGKQFFDLLKREGHIVILYAAGAIDMTVSVSALYADDLCRILEHETLRMVGNTQGVI